jgi:lipopolysaccharide transport system permease protein
VTSALARTSAARDRALIGNFFRRELTTRYLGSVTGFAWALLTPVLLLAVYYFVFTRIFPQRGDGSFLAFLWPWQATQEALQRGTTALSGYAGLIRKVAFPHELVIYASVGATFALQFVGYVAVLAILKLIGEPIHFEGLLLAVPLWMILVVAITGVTLATSALQVFVRDVEHVLPPLLMIYFYLTPIFYPPSAVPDVVRPWIAVNPFAWLVARMRDALLDGNLALRASDSSAVVVALMLFLVGRWVFRRLSPHFEDFV